MSTNNSDRGMKKWAPYKSLNEQEFFMQQMREKKSRVEKPIISDDLAEEINNVLMHYKTNTIYVMNYYHNGHIYEIEQSIIEIDIINRIIKCSEVNIFLDDLLQICEK